MLSLCIHRACCEHLAVEAKMFVFIMRECVMPSCFRSMQSRDSQLRSAKKFSTHSPRRMLQQQLHACRYSCHALLCVYSNLVLFFRRIITHQALVKHSFRTATCDFMCGYQVFRAQNILQRLLFVHHQQFLVDKAGRKRIQRDGQGRNTWACHEQNNLIKG